MNIYRLRRTKKLSNDDMLALISNFIDELGRLPKSKEIDANPMLPTANTLRSRFGSLKNALDLAQDRLRSNKHKYTDKELLDLLRELGEKKGRMPTVADVRADPNMPSVSTYMAHFGGIFANALIRAGYRKGYHRYRRYGKYLLEKKS